MSVMLVRNKLRALGKKINCNVGNNQALRPALATAYLFIMCNAAFFFEGEEEDFIPLLLILRPSALVFIE